MNTNYKEETKMSERSKRVDAYFAEMEGVMRVCNAQVKKYPYEDGAVKAYWAWRNGKEYNGKPVLKYALYGDEIADFCKTLRIAGVDQFVIADESTALMRNIHGFIEEGCSWGGIFTWRKTYNLYGETMEENTYGLNLYL